MLVSNYRTLAKVDLPYQGRQRYMHGFDLANPVMADGFEDYREPVIELYRAAGATAGTAYMTVDEKIVRAGQSQRKPKPHVDGCFQPEMLRWGHSWAHHCNNIPIARMPVIVAASVAGCKVWKGLFDAIPSSDGDLSHIADQLDEGYIVPDGVGCLLSPDCIHESLPFAKDTQRSFLRIALPVGFDCQM